MKSFKLTETEDHLTGKKMRSWRHAGGMRVKILPRPGFSKKFAAVTVPFGSIHMAFETPDGICRVPAGTAHFLEHCIFSRDGDGGLLGRLSGMGASANAYTTYNHTLYYFSAVDHFAESLSIYLDAIFNPYLGEDRIEAEKPIILAEVSQMMDDPDTRCYDQLIQNLYTCHPVREEIAGTAESVKAIKGRDLETAHCLYYNPASISLTLAGDITEEPILASLAARLGMMDAKADGGGILVLPDEPAVPGTGESRLAMAVSAPSFLVGFKDPDASAAGRLAGPDLVFRQRAGHLFLDSLLSPASPLYDELYSDGLINDSFGFHYACEDSFAFLVCGGESDHPEEAADKIRSLLSESIRRGVDAGLFEIQKRAAAGNFVASLDSVENSGLVQAQCNLYGMELFDYPGIYDKIDCSSAARVMDFLGRPSNSSIVILHPEVSVSHDL